jgi:hypothetical protein
LTGLSWVPVVLGAVHQVALVRFSELLVDMAVQEHLLLLLV